MHRGSRPRGLLGTRGRTGLASTVVPVLVGVIVAFAWNMATSHGPQVPQPGAGLAPTVGTAVDQAADQAWASATPITTHLPYRSTPPARAASRGPASTGCHRAGSSRVVRTAPAVDSAHASVGRRSAAADVSSLVGVSPPPLSLSWLVEARFPANRSTAASPGHAGVPESGLAQPRRAWIS